MNYKDILNDPEIINIYNKIDKDNLNSIVHGKQHVLNVLDNLDKLNKILNINNKDLELLKIAITLHDTGHLYGKDKHSEKSAEFAQKYLNNKLDSDDLNKVISSIKNHHEKINIDNISLFDHILLFADKMDFSNKRLNPNYRTREYLMESNILEVNFSIDKDTFCVIIKTNNIDIDKFKYWDYYSKIYKRIEEFAYKINKKFEIKTIF